MDTAVLTNTKKAIDCFALIGGAFDPRKKRINDLIRPRGAHVMSVDDIESLADYSWHMAHVHP